jgi:hypothetical protein
MPLPSPIIAQFTDLVQHRPLASRDSYGQPSYGSPTTYQARVVPSAAKITTANGSEVVARTVIYLATTDLIDPSDQLTLPDLSTPGILRVDRYPDLRMPHTKIYVGA